MSILSYRMAVGAAAILVAAGLTACNRDGTSGTKPPATAPVAASGVPGPRNTPPAEKADGSLPDMCQVLSKEDVSAVLQSEFTSAKPSIEVGENTCDYNNANGDDGVTVGISATTLAAFDSDAQGYPPVAGVGDGAFDDAVLLYVRDGDYKVSVSAGGGDTVRIALAQKVITKLPSSTTPTSNEVPSS